MREIKFRAWDKGRNFYWLYDAGYSKYKGGFYLKDGGCVCMNIGYFFNDDKYVIEQYTGLNDKNGKPIYEGDIFQWSDIRTDNIAGTVEFRNGAFCFCRHDKPNMSYAISIPANGSIHTEPGEIIGNIHENPELLS